MIKYCGKRKEIEDSLWSVFTSFGFIEVENNDDFKNSSESGKFCYFENGKCVAEKKGSIKNIDIAESAAICVEASIANGLDNFTVEVENEDVFNILTLFGFEKMIKKNPDVNGYKVVSDGECYCCFDNGKCMFDIYSFMNALEKAGIDMSDIGVDASLIFAEKDAEGLAYDVAYNLRVNGCIVEYYTEDDSIENACSFAEKKGMSCVLRAYPDGILQIKDMIKNEITETTVADFLGYYEEEEDCDCGCGHDHHDHHDCHCGHDHGEEHECSCGHHHDDDHECKCGHHHK